MFAQRNLAFALVCSAASLIAALPASTRLPIAIGYYGFPCAGCYNAQRVTWQFPTLNTSDPLYSTACTNHTSISTITLGSNGWRPPICGSPFDIDDLKGLTLACEGGDGSGRNDVTAILDADGVLYETCTPVTKPQELCGATVYNGAIEQYYLCQ